MSIFVQNTTCSNSGSIERAIKAISNQKIHFIDNLNAQYLENGDKFILPGVSNFDPYMLSLKKNGFLEFSQTNTLTTKKWIIGICAGAQILFESSEEGTEKGVGLLKGKVKKINTNLGIKVPHLGWNNIILNQNHPMAHLFDGIALENKKFYFSHSYHFPDSEDVLAYVDYGERFPAVVAKDNIIAVQFHPEKSYTQGLRFLKNICEL
jgi:glutamine amidotransferase